MMIYEAMSLRDIAVGWNVYDRSWTPHFGQNVG